MDFSMETPTQAPVEAVAAPAGGDLLDILMNPPTAPGSGSVMNATAPAMGRAASLNQPGLSLLEQLELGHGKGEVEFPEDVEINLNEVPGAEEASEAPKEEDFFASLANR